MVDPSKEGHDARVLVIEEEIIREMKGGDGYMKAAAYRIWLCLPVLKVVLNKAMEEVIRNSSRAW